jgi:fatty acid desaturase
MSEIAGDLLTLRELQDLRRISGLRSALLVLHAWGTIAAAMALYAVWPSTVTLVVAVVIVGARQLGLTVLVHEAAHWRLFRRPRANDRVARWLCAYPVGGELSLYRRRHHLHHRHTQQPDDPDLALTARLPVPRTRLWWDALCDLVGFTAGARVAGWSGWTEGPSAAWRRIRGPFVSNLALLGTLVAPGHGQLYVVLWLLPLATWYQLVTRLRDVAEHGQAADSADPLRNARTVEAGLIARALLAPYWVGYHLEHHLFVFVPCWKLRQAHALLLAKGYGGRLEVARGYREVVRRVTATR